MGFFQQRQLVLRVVRHLAGQRVGQLMLLVVGGCLVLALQLQRGQQGLAAVARALGLLPGVVQRL